MMEKVPNCRSNTIGSCHKKHFKKLALQNKSLLVCMDKFFFWRRIVAKETKRTHTCKTTFLE